jgi:hypothetical protein
VLLTPVSITAPALLRFDGEDVMTQKKTRNDKPQDPKNPASKPNATTQDQVANMESEGQAQQSGQEPTDEVVDEKARKRQEKGNRGPGDQPGFGQGA